LAVQIRANVSITGKWKTVIMEWQCQSSIH